jgi:hypothetical protein
MPGFWNKLGFVAGMLGGVVVGLASKKAWLGLVAFVALWGIGWVMSWIFRA